MKPCADCNNIFPPCCMDFDHRPGTIKLFGIGESVACQGKAKLQAEIAKCDVVCANCHRIRTENRKVRSITNKEKYGKV